MSTHSSPIKSVLKRHQSSPNTAVSSPHMSSLTNYSQTRRLTPAGSIISRRSAGAILVSHTNRRFASHDNKSHRELPLQTNVDCDHATATAVTAEAVVDMFRSSSLSAANGKHYGSMDQIVTDNKSENSIVKPQDAGEIKTDTNGDDNTQRFSFRKLTARKRLTLMLICATAFFWSVVFACIGPFFPSEALAKGANPTEVGGIFGIFELVIMISSPLWGRVVPILGPRFMYLAGVFTTGFTNILYGSLQWAPPGRTFVVLCFILRSVEGLGAACYMTASLPILAHQFPGHISSVIGIESTFVSTGFMLGPLVGSILYTVDGFYLPFVVLGSTGIIMCIIGVVLLPPIEYETETEEHVGLFKVISIPIVPLVLLCNVSASAGLAFFDAMLSPHLKYKFNLSEILIGIWFLMMGVCEACTAPFVGYLLDTKPWHLQAMLVGTLLAFAGYVLVGPSPLLPFLPEVIPVSVAAQLFVGLAIGFLFVPPAGLIFKACQGAGLPDGPGVHGAIGGLITLSASFGGFFGPTVGGYVVQIMSFEWASTIAAGLFLFEAGLLLATILKRALFSTHKKS